jgi:large subunit ribosomal protein L10
LTVSEMTELRVEARKQNVYLRVVRNTLARRAVEGTDFACRQEGMTGPVSRGIAMEEPGAVARGRGDCAKDNKQLEVKMVSLGGKLFPASELDRLAKMPTKEQAISMFMGTLKAPIEKFVRTLQAPTSKMVRTFAAVRDAKDAA